MESNKLVDNFLEIRLKEDDDFLKVKETLTRIGISSKKENILYQSCHILHKQRKYYIVHFKELFALDGKETDISESDIERRNAIACLLEEWNLLEIVNRDIVEQKAPISSIKIISFSDKNNWQLVQKYNIGKKR